MPMQRFKNRMKERQLKRLDEVLSDGVAEGLMTADEADEIRENAKGLEWLVILQMILEIIAAFLEKRQTTTAAA